jgi:hypothetical protein
MKPIAILQHVANDGPCSFTEYLAAHELPWREFRADLGEALPGDIDAFCGYAVLGGQLMARALGATVTASPSAEIGWHELAACSAAAALAESRRIATAIYTASCEGLRR